MQGKGGGAWWEVPEPQSVNLPYYCFFKSTNWSSLIIFFTTYRYYNFFKTSNDSFIDCNFADNVETLREKCLRSRC